jgi:hypothetical protein
LANFFATSTILTTVNISLLPRIEFPSNDTVEVIIPGKGPVQQQVRLFFTHSPIQSYPNKIVEIGTFVSFTLF